MLAPGTREVLVIWTGGIKSVERWIEGDAEYELLAEGPARGYSGVELEGGAFASASASNVAAHASMGRSLEFQIDHLLVGWFLFPPIFSGAYPASATLTSDDSFDRCVDARFQTFVAAAAPDTSRCLFSHRIGLEARGAGSYELDWTGAGAAYGHIPLIGIADVEWPSSG